MLSHNIPVVEEVLGKLLKVGGNLPGPRVVVELLEEDLTFAENSLCVGLVFDAEEGLAVVDEGRSISIDLLRGNIVGLTDGSGHKPGQVVNELVQLWVDHGLCPHGLDVTDDWIQTVTLGPTL